MISKEEWEALLVREHFLLKDTLTEKEFIQIIVDSEKLERKWKDQSPKTIFLKRSDIFKKKR